MTWYKTISKKKYNMQIFKSHQGGGVPLFEKKGKKNSPKSVTVPRSGMAVAFMMLKKGVKKWWRWWK